MKIKNYVRKKRYLDYIIAFILCAMSTFIFFIISKYQMGWNSTLVLGDAQELYLPGLKALTRNIRSGNSLLYSWDLSMGMNSVEYYTAVVGGSLFNLVYVMFPYMHMEIFLIMSMTLKAGFAGITFVFFAKTVLRVDGKWGAFFSIFYALCSFQTSINSVNIIWGDMIYMLPLILGLIVIFIEDGRWLGLVASYAYCFVCNFYIAYIVGIFSAIFFVVYICIYKHNIKDILKKGVSYALHVILAAGLVACVLMPTALFLVDKYNTPLNMDKDRIIANNLIVYIGRFLFGAEWNESIRYPYLYCGLLPLLLLPLFYINKKIDVKEKIMYTILFFIMMVSCVSMPLYIFWHGFDEPDMWYYRFAFIISFLCVSVSCKSMAYLKDLSIKSVLITVISEACVLGIAGMMTSYEIGEPKRSYLVVNVIFILVWVLVYLYSFHNKRKSILKNMVMVLAMIEVIWNGCIGHRIYQSKTDEIIVEKEMSDAIIILQQQPGFYRVNNDNRVMINSDTNWGYNGTADFCSFENQELRLVLSNLGGYTSSRVMKGHGLNDFTQMILAVKYNLLLSGGYIENEMGASIQQYPRTLNIGFLVDEKIKSFDFKDNVFENNNDLASAMMGEQIDLFYAVPREDIRTEAMGVEMKEQGGYFFINDETKEETNQFVFSVPYKGDKAYVVFGKTNRGILSGVPLIWEPDSGKDNGLITVRYTKQLDYDGENLICSIMMKKDITNDEGYVEDIEFRYLSTEAIERIYDNLSQHQLEVQKYKNGYLKGAVKVDSKNKILFTSIPYDKGWRIKSSSEDIRIIPLLDGAFLGVEFPHEGDFELEFIYEVPGLKIGIIISAICIIVTVLLWSNRKGKKGYTNAKTQEESN